MIQDGSAVNQILETLGSLAAVDLGSQIQDTHMSGRDKLAIQVSSIFLLCFFLFAFPCSYTRVVTYIWDPSCFCSFLYGYLLQGSCFSHSLVFFSFSSSVDKTRAFTSNSGSGVQTGVWMLESSP